MRQEHYKLDNRTRGDIRKQLGELAKSYVPEWSFDESNPDIGSVLALLFSDQLYGNVERFNEALERYHTEFVNLLDISLLPAHPASATVLMELVPDTVPEVPVAQGTKLLADEDGEKIVFETSFPVCLSGSRLRAALMTSAEEGKIVPLFGEFRETDYAGEELHRQDEPVNGLPAFPLFRFEGKGLERQALVMCHSNIFDVENETIYCRFTGNPDLLSRIAKGEFRFLYYTEEGFLAVESVQVMGEHILLIKEKPSKKVMIGDREYSMLVLEAEEPQQENISIDSVAFSSVGGARRAEYAGNGTTDYETADFAPFGDTLSLFSECYIGMDDYFSKADSRITLRFDTKYSEHFVGFTRQQEEQELKIIKRKPRVSTETMLSYCSADEISISYYNGIGWKRLECEEEYRTLFAGMAEGSCELSFHCPADWQPASTGGYHGRTLRIQLLKADNCYYQPCIHRYPELSDLMISYTYENQFEKPEYASVLCGTSRNDLTRKLQENRPFTVFARGNYNDTALYLGFDRVFTNGPVSLWWKLTDVEPGRERKLRYFYSTLDGFKEMKVVDYTENLTRSGIMLFLPADDMALYEMEEKRLCWIKVVDESGQEKPTGGIVEKIMLNAVEVQNIETLEEEEFYLDTVGSELSFPLQADGILDADVWVNEKDVLTEEAMRQMMSEQPDRVRVNLNYLGDIEEFFVKWEERDSFAASGVDSRHYILDRMQGRILFGDGVHVRIPRNTEATAFTVQVRKCRGRAGNVAAGAIEESQSNLMYVQDIYNPEPAFGGSNMETLERALRRGADRISSGGRFVTEEDYIREILSFSDMIERAAVTAGTDRDGESHERMLYIILLMRDFEEGSASFYRMQGDLKRHLLQHCELSIAPEELQLEEPVFVELNVDVWMQVNRIEDSFEIQNLVTGTLRDYLNPVGNERHRGWEIGVLPRKAQIIMKLNALKSRGIIKQVLVVATYTDSSGRHEIDLDDMKVSPFMVAKSGKHRVHISKSENRGDQNAKQPIASRKDI